jgi:hypothetical protein
MRDKPAHGEFASHVLVAARNNLRNSIETAIEIAKSYGCSDEDIANAVEDAWQAAELVRTCKDPNPLMPALLCSLPEGHEERLHAADSAMGHHQWRQG